VERLRRTDVVNDPVRARSDSNGGDCGWEIGDGSTSAVGADQIAIFAGHLEISGLLNQIEQLAHGFAADAPLRRSCDADVFLADIFDVAVAGDSDGVDRTRAETRRPLERDLGVQNVGRLSYRNDEGHRRGQRRDEHVRIRHQLFRFQSV
jgi:hypothetical protein